MVPLSISEAQARLPELVSAAEAGEIVLIRTASGRTIRLTAQPGLSPHPMLNPAWSGYPHPGSAQGLIEIAPDFDSPLAELREYEE